MSRGRKIAALAAVVAGLAGAAGGVAMAQGTAPPVVTVTVGSGSVSVEGADAPQAGPTTFRFETTGRGSFEGVLAGLLPGKTMADFEAALPRALRQGPQVLKSIVTFETGGSPLRNRPYTTTIDLRPGVTYIAGSIPMGPGRPGFATFTVGGTTNTATRPAPAATVNLYSFAFGMDDVLPRTGVVRFQNVSENQHMAIAFPVRRASRRVAVVKAFLRDRPERVIRRLVRERDVYEALGTVSPGTVNDVAVSFPRRGSYVFVCFVEDGERGDPPHYQLGMVKAFSVR